MEDIGAALKDFGTSMQRLIVSEMQLARVELKDKITLAGRHAGMMVAYGVFALLGTLPFIAFLVIGLGRLLEGNYWLSSLIVAVVCMGVGAAMAYRSYSKLKSEDMSLSRTQRTLEEDKQIITDAAQGAVQSGGTGGQAA